MTPGALVCASMPMVLLVFWLIVSYKVNIINPPSLPTRSRSWRCAPR